MITINLWDSNFPGQSCSVAGQESMRVRYVRDQLQWDGITVFTDGQMFSPAVDAVQSPIKIGWLQEPQPLHPENYVRSWDVRHKFDAILTYDQALLDADPVYRFTIRGGVWMPREGWGVYPKSKHVSMILSEKRSIESHRLRHAIADAGLGIDLYGSGSTTPIGYDKAIAYRDYRYAVVVDTTREENYFSEHLLDALSFGCVPIYWGCPNIGEFLDERGVIPLTNIADLSRLLSLLNEEGDLFYQLHLPSVLKNLARLDQYRVTEDWQAEHIYEPMLEAIAV